MKLRDKGKQPLELQEQMVARPEDNEGFSQAVEKEISLNHMEQALNSLNHEQKLCVTLFYLEKQSYQQISSTTGYSSMQVKSHIQNGKRNLKIMMQRMQTDE